MNITTHPMRRSLSSGHSRWRWHLVAAAVASGFLTATGHAQINYATPYFFTTLAGVNAAGSTDGTGSAARFFLPAGIAVDAAGTVYVSDMNNHTIRKITFYGVVTTFAGTVGIPGAANGTGSAARFNLPRGLALDASGNLYVADTSNHLIRKITPAGVVTTFAGNGAGSVDGTGGIARFFSPNGVAVDVAGNVYVADTANHSIRKITSVGIVTTLAGGLSPTLFGSTDGTGAGARFNSPRGVAVDFAGNVYVADRDNYAIRKITPAGVVTTLAGLAVPISGHIDGTGSAARFNQVYGVAVDHGYNVYVADLGSSSIRKITADGVVTTLAGGGGVGSTDGTGSAVRFSSPQAIAIDPRDSNLYVADTNNHTIRMNVFAPNFTVHPQSLLATPGGGGQFNAVSSSNVPITHQWQKDGVAIPGATTATPDYSAAFPPIFYSSVNVTNIQTPNLGSYTLVATNMAGSSTSRPGVLSFAAPPVFVTQPTSQSVAPGTTVTFTATVTSNLPVRYAWFKDERDVGDPSSQLTNTLTNTLTVPNVQVADLGFYQVVAVNAAGFTISDRARLSFIPLNIARLSNLSVLTNVASAGDSFTMGYVVGGAGTTGSKPILIRAVGPTLGAAPFNIPGILADPKLELFAGATKTTENDNWGGTPALTNAFVSVGAFAYVNGTSLDAAVFTNIASGDNSVRVSANGNGAGTVIAELYDSTPFAQMTAASPRLVNVSVLKHLGALLTVGFVVDGNGSKKVLIRAVGPTIGTLFGVAGVVADPQLTLFSGSTSIGTNDNWGGTAELTAAFTQVGAFQLPAASRDAALLATLQPGNYTVQVSGVNNTTGVAIVEVYEVP